jgi:hypothetical protein
MVSKSPACKETALARNKTVKLLFVIFCKRLYELLTNARNIATFMPKSKRPKPHIEMFFDSLPRDDY